MLTSTFLLITHQTQSLAMTWFLHNMPIVRSIWLILSDTTWRDDNRTRYLRVSELITPYSGVISLLGGDLAPGVVVGWFRASSNCVSVVWRCPVYLPSVLSLFFSLFRLAVMDEVTICCITHNNLIFPWKPDSGLQTKVLLGARCFISQHVSSLKFKFYHLIVISSQQ